MIVQTLAPDAASIAAAARHDADGFLDGELARREALRYPPFSHLIRIVCSAPDPHAVADAATRGPRARSATIPGATILGPAPLFRLRGRERAQLVIKGAHRARGRARRGRRGRAPSRASARAAASRSRVDVDPQ